MHAILFALAAAPPPLSGPYQTTHSTMKMPDPHHQHPIDVYYPLNTAENLRFVSFAHGAGGGSVILPVVYKSLLHSLASWGYVVAATKACMMGSNDTCHYYEHQLRVIDWARGKAADGTAPFALANFSTVAIVGHSMGGEATMLNSQASSAATYHIGAAVMLHAFTHHPVPPAVPFLAFTGTTDTTAPMAMTEAFYNAASAGLPRGLVEKVNASHQEPTDYNDKSEPYNPYMQQFVAGWLKLHLDQTPRAMGVDWDGLLYGAGAASLCGGGDGAMHRCEVHRGGRAAATGVVEQAATLAAEAREVEDGGQPTEDGGEPTEDEGAGVDAAAAASCRTRGHLYEGSEDATLWRAGLAFVSSGLVPSPTQPGCVPRGGT